MSSHGTSLSRLLLTRSMFATMMLALSGALIGSYLEYRSLLEQQRQGIARLEQTLALPAAQIAFDVDTTSARQFVRGVVQNPRVLEAHLYDEFGGLLAEGAAVSGRPAIPAVLQWLVPADRARDIPLFSPRAQEYRVGQLLLTIDETYPIATLLPSMGRGILVGISGGLVIGLVLYWLFGRMVTRPITRLAEQVNAAADISSSYSRAALELPDPANGSELTLLANNLNLYQEKLLESESRLAKANLELEARVEERTWLLREAERRNRIILNSAGEGIIGLDLNGRIYFCNHVAASLLGYEERELIGQNMHEAVHYARADGSPYLAEDCPMTGVMDTSQSTTKDDEVFWRKDGSCFPIEYNAVPMLEEGQVLGSVIVFRDISDRLARQRELDSQRSQMHSIIESAPDPLIVVTPDGRIETVNQQVSQVLGYAREALLGASIDQLVPERARDHHGQLILDYFANPRQREMGAGLSLHALKADGQQIPVEISLSPLTTDKGSRVIALLRDVTLRRQQAAELAHREQQFRRLIETVPGTVFQCSTDADWRMDFISDEVERLTGRSPAAFVGEGALRFSELIVEEDRQRVLDEIYAGLDAGGLYNVEYRLNHINGEIRHVLEKGSMIYGNQESPADEQHSEARLVGAIIDLTDQRLAELEVAASAQRFERLFVEAQQNAEELAEKQNLIRSLLDNTPDLIFAKDLEGRFIAVNRALEAFAGKSREEILGHTDAEHYSAEVAETFREQDDAIMAAGQARHFEEVITYPDGHQILVDTLKTPVIDDSGETVGLLGISRDITERKKAEAAMQEALEAAEAATRAKSDFLANMSHEIRTPMNAIIGMSDLALRTQLDDRQRNYIEKAHSAANSLLGIINDLLDFSKIEAGKLEIEAVPFHLDEVLGDLAGLLSYRAEQKGLELLISVDTDIPMGLVGDPLRLAQVLTNLGTNAIKFTDQGEVVVRVEREQRPLPSDRIALRFSVTDSGIGMSPDQVSRIFDSFSQADTSTTRRFGGTGLGLSICRNLCELMGADISVVSEPDVGSTFSFGIELPVSGDQPRLADPRLIRKVSLAGLRALVVDDNSQAREILADLLASFKVQVDTAASGEEAIAMIIEADESPYTLVVMDWQMPTMDGIEATRRIQSIGQQPDIPTIIMVTAYGREDAQASAGDVDIRAFLNKPVTASTLLDAIMAVVQPTSHRVEPLSRAARAAEESAQPLAGARVLLVEDNAMNQEVASELLAMNGMAVTVANNGQEAIDILEDQVFDCVLMDCQMPVLDGYEATRRLRGESRFAELPILALTANAMAGDREKVLAAGMNDHIAKPINPADMLETMVRWINVDAIQGGAGAATPSDAVASSKPTVDPLPDTPELDTDAGLTVTQGNRALYQKLLGRFVETQSDFVTQFHGLVADADAEGAERAAHSLKGVAANLGATPLREAAARLEAACREAEPSEARDAALDAVASRLTALLEDLTHWQATQASSENHAAANNEALNNALKRLRPLLEASDLDALDLVADLADSQANADTDRLTRRLATEVENFRFAEALACLDELETHLDAQ